MLISVKKFYLNMEILERNKLALQKKPRDYEALNNDSELDKISIADSASIKRLSTT